MEPLTRASTSYSNFLGIFHQVCFTPRYHQMVPSQWYREMYRGIHLYGPHSWFQICTQILTMGQRRDHFGLYTNWGGTSPLGKMHPSNNRLNPRNPSDPSFHIWGYVQPVTSMYTISEAHIYHLNTTHFDPSSTITVSATNNGTPMSWTLPLY